MADKVEKIGRSIVQHGPYNRRVYLMKPHRREALSILPTIDRLAQDNHYEKILAKVPSGCKAAYEKQGYVQEALIPDYFKHQEHALFMCKYLSVRRKQITHQQQIKDILLLTEQHRQHPSKNNTPGASIRSCGPDDALEISQVFKTVFKTYPFPIFDADYLVKVMKNKQARYFCVENQRQINAVAAAEIDSDHGGAEMTDFATLPEYRGQGLAGGLLDKMEQSIAGQGMKLAYSIARALSPAMNLLFAKKGYSFGGTLVNNTNISGRIESMNVWYKSIGSSFKMN